MQDIDDKLHRFFNQGVDARAQGKRPGDNPYCPGTAERAEWAKGWSAILDLDEDRDPGSLRVRDDD